MLSLISVLLEQSIKVIKACCKSVLFDLSVLKAEHENSQSKKDFINI